MRKGEYYVHIINCNQPLWDSSLSFALSHNTLVDLLYVVNNIQILFCHLNNAVITHVQQVNSHMIMQKLIDYL